MAVLNKSIATSREIYKSPAKRILALVCAIIIIELVIMLFMEYIPNLPYWVGALFDSLLLITLLAPVIYLLIFRPMTKYVSNHEQIVKSLSKEKDFVESLVQTANVIIVGLDSKNRVNILNKTAENITGYTLNELKGKNWFDVMIPQKIYPQLWQQFNTFTREGNMPRTFENPILTKTGEERIVSWQNGLLHEGEQLTGIISYGIDITERIQADKALEQIYRQHQMILNSAAEGILGIDLNGNHIFCNQAAAAMLGYSTDELMGQHSHSLYHHTKPDGSPYPESECRILLTLVTGVGRHNINETFWRKDGSGFKANCSTNPIYEDNKVIGAVLTFTDITENLQKEQDILKFKLGIEHSKDAIFITDPEGKITYINKSFERIFGYTPEEVIGNTPRILKSGIAPPSFYQTLWNSLLNKQALSNEMVNKAKDGRLITMDTSNNPLLDEAGNILGFLSVNRDITERKQRELELQILSEIGQSVSATVNLNELMKLIHHSLKKVLYAENCYFALFDKNTNSISFPYFVDQFDETPMAFNVDRSCTSYVLRTGKSIIITSEVFDQLCEENEIESVGYPSLSWIGVPLRTSARTVGVLVLQNYEEENVYREEHLRFLDSIASQIANVVERRRVKEEQQKSYSLITATLESTADGILVVDSLGKVTNYNRKFIELWRVPESIVATNDDHQIITFVLDQLKDPDSFLAKVKELYSHPEDTSFDLLEFKDGRIFERYSQPQIFEGRSLGRVWSFRNVTERKEAEEALKESEARLRMMNSTKDKFFSIISHDLKSPFQGLIGLSDILKKEAYSLDRPTIAEYSDLINSSILQSYRLLENLLEWARIQRDMISFNPSDLSLKKLIDEVVELQADNARKKTITVINCVPEEMLARADRNMLTTIIRNLLSNAIKFSPFHQSVQISCVENELETQISVSDFGCGISPEDQLKLFKAESNFSTYGTDNESGTGLGLLLCKEFTEKHKGRIWIESEVGKGSTFCFVIPKDLS